MSGEPAAGAAPATTDAPATTTAAPATTTTNVLADVAPTETKAVAGDAVATAAKDGDTDTKAKAADGETGKDGKAADADKPIEYTDFTLPEGVEIDTEALAEAKTLFAGEKLPQETAQKMVDLYAAKVKQYGEAQSARWVQLQQKWVGEFKSDAEIGGDKLNESVAAAKRAMDKFGTPGLREALAMTGAGNHPEVIRFVARVGKATSEDSLVVASGPSGGTKSTAEVFYPNQGKEAGS